MVTWLAPVASAYPTGHGPTTRTASISTVLRTNHKVVSRSFPETYVVGYEASISTNALLDVIYTNRSNELVLFNATSDSSKVLQKYVPGGNQTECSGIIAAGEAFLVLWETANSSSPSDYTESMEKVTAVGKISHPTLPIDSDLFWEFDYGNATRLFVSTLSTGSAVVSPRELIELNATSLHKVANYSGEYPRGATLFSVLPLGDRVYLAGTVIPTSGGPNAYFGYVNLTTKKTVRVSKLISDLPCSANICLLATYYSLIAFETNVYVVGDLVRETANANFTEYNETTVGGYFYSFDPSTSAFKNLSSLLPVKSWGAYSLELWGSTIALGLNGWTEVIDTVATITTITGGVYTLASGPSLVNQTSVFPKGYASFTYDDNSASVGWYFGAGFNTVKGIGEVVAVKT